MIRQSFLLPFSAFLCCAPNTMNRLAVVQLLAAMLTSYLLKHTWQRQVHDADWIDGNSRSTQPTTNSKSNNLNNKHLSLIQTGTLCQACSIPHRILTIDCDKPVSDSCVPLKQTSSTYLASAQATDASVQDEDHHVPNTILISPIVTVWVYYPSSNIEREGHIRAHLRSSIRWISGSRCKNENDLVEETVEETVDDDAGYGESQSDLGCRTWMTR